jgi:hypothetical protein
MATSASTRRGNKTSAEPSAETAREVLTQAVRIQLASITAASKFFAGWAQAADRYAQELSDELLARARGETASSELIGHLATASSLHLHEITTLPSIAVRHFNRQLASTAKSRKA